ncbi:MAG: bacteriocin [Sphingobacteriaceae bacterium]|jgi:bacteriocin-like protein|nr:MAG: bacteriocin [Pedobacter sp.]
MKKLNVDLFGVHKLNTKEMKTVEGGVLAVGSAGGILAAIALAYVVPLVAVVGAVALVGGGTYAIYKLVR